MSAIRSKHKLKVLDFSDESVTKNIIKQALNSNEFIAIFCDDNGIDLPYYTDYEIKIGIYNITLFLDYSKSKNAKLLKDYGKFGISINESTSKGIRWINLSKDVRFKNQKWVTNNSKYKLSISKLLEIILYCKRLNNLKSFY